jgi:hypothetical protein
MRVMKLRERVREPLLASERSAGDISLRFLSGCWSMRPERGAPGSGRQVVGINVPEEDGVLWNITQDKNISVKSPIDYIGEENRTPFSGAGWESVEVAETVNSMTRTPKRFCLRGKRVGDQSSPIGADWSPWRLWVEATHSGSE